MIKRLIQTSLIGILLIFSNCEERRIGFEYIVISKTPVNFEEINSVYDDYNSADPGNFLEDHLQIYFSSNRDNSGESFDIIKFDIYLSFEQGNGNLFLDSYRRAYIMPDIVNSELSNEFGPYLYIKGTDKTLVFASDRNGDLNIYFYDFSQSFLDSIPDLNTNSNEAYATVHTAASMYFCSDRDGDYDIYETDNFLNDYSINNIINVSELNSNQDDKCPYIKNNLMLFASDRDGGFGGFDLWYSVFNGTTWDEPINFGERINTEYDEYRPILIETDTEKYLNDMMVFSSNRPRGKGGFDLYYVGISNSLGYN